jgi:hypothetical protein
VTRSAATADETASESINVTCGPSGGAGGYINNSAPADLPNQVSPSQNPIGVECEPQANGEGAAGGVSCDLVAGSGYVEVAASDPHSESRALTLLAAMARTAATAAPSGAQAYSASSGSWAWTSSDAGGYSATYKLDIGMPSRLSNAPLLSGYSSSDAVGQACPDFSAPTDALIPMELTISNTASGLSEAENIYLQAGADTITHLEIVSLTSAGAATCGEAASGRVPLGCNLRAGGLCMLNTYVIVRSYYSPSVPGGNTSALTGLTLAVGSSGPSIDTSISTVVGPGVEPYQGMPNFFAIPLSG